MTFEFPEWHPICCYDHVTGPGRLPHSGKFFVIAALAIAAIVIVAVIAIRQIAPFSRASITKQVETETGLRFEAATYHTSWFPAGFSAQGVRLVDPAARDTKPLLTAKTMSVRGSYLGLLRSPRFISAVHLTEAVITIPANGADLLKRLETGSSTALGELIVDASELDIPQSGQGSEPLRFTIRRLVLHRLGQGVPVGFEVAMTNPKPHGEIHSTGHFGPWNSQNHFATPVSGSFTFDQVDLNVDHALAAVLNSNGKFTGVLGSIEARGSADLPKFEVYGTAHPTHLASNFEAVVNARNGDVALKHVEAHFDHTTISAEGGVGGKPDETGKTTDLHLAVREGRIEDLLNMFTSGRPSMTGGLTFEAGLQLPPGVEDFLTRLAVTGDFTIQEARFTDSNTQQPIDRLSGSAQGEKKPEVDEHPPRVLAHVHGHISDAGGIATLSNVLFSVPGVDAKLRGTFALTTTRIDLAGDLSTTGQLSDTKTGVKSIFLKVVSPIWKKKAKEEIVPFRVTGTSSNPSVTLQLHR